MPEKELVAIVYPFFAHYRDAVNSKLNESKRCRYLFVGARTGRDGIEVWKPSNDFAFLETRNVTVMGFLFQSGLIRLAFRRDVKQIIFLADAHYVTTWLAAFLARLTGKRVLFWTHGWTKVDTGLKRIFRLVFYRLAHDLLLYGHHAKNIGIQEGFLPEHLHVVYNSLDYPAQVTERQSVTETAIAKVRSTLFKNPQYPLLIYIGRLTLNLRFHLLLDALSLLKRQGFEANLLIIGDGPARSGLLSRAVREGLNVNSYGACYVEAVLAGLLMAADLTVVCGRVGLTGIHSLAYGTPVLAHSDPEDQHPEWESIISGYNGCYFAKDDSHDLARAIREWLAEAPERKQLRRQCCEVVNRFYNPEYQAAQIERALDGEPSTDAEWEAFKSLFEKSF